MKFEAEVEAVRTRASDMTYHVTLELPEYQLAEAQQLLAMIHDLVQVEVVLLGSNPDKRQVKGTKLVDDERPARTRRKR